MRPGQVIDMHNDQAAEDLFRHTSTVDSVAKSVAQIGSAYHCKEMLIAWWAPLDLSAGGS